MAQSREDRSSRSKLFVSLVSIPVHIRTAAVELRKNAIALLWKTKRSEEAEEALLARLAQAIPGFAQYGKEGMLRRLRERATLKGFKSLDGYAEFLFSDEEELAYLSENLTRIGSHFFRGTVWPTLERVCSDAFGPEQAGTVHVWCAGCSTGKEVYSLLMMLLDHVPADRLDVFATDYNAEAVAHCLQGNYPLRTIDEIPQKHHHYVEVREGSHDLDFAYWHQIQFADELRGMIRAEQQNLLTDEYPTGFDLVFCRNVIKFFTPEAQAEVQAKLARSLNAGGFLVVSENAAEQIADPAALGLEQLDGTCIYRKK